jgi:hypothetical protein
MATTTKQDQNFKDEVISTTLLEDAIEWIQKNMEPEDVFTDRQLRAWADANSEEQEHE